MNFKKLSDVETVNKPTDSAHVLIEENGVIKKTPKTAVGGGNSNGEYDMVIRVTDINNGNYEIAEGSYDNVATKTANHIIPKIQIIIESCDDECGGVYEGYGSFYGSMLIITAYVFTSYGYPCLMRLDIDSNNSLAGFNTYPISLATNGGD